MGWRGTAGQHSSDLISDPKTTPDARIGRLVFAFAVALFAHWLAFFGQMRPALYMALIARITRAAMLDVLAQDYIRTEHAKGLAPGSVLVGHALKNAAVPIVTIVGIGIALLISGAIVTETVFAIPGIGRLTVDAILRRDYPIIQGVILMFSAAYVLINLAVDVLYVLIDPRIRYG